MLSSFNHTIEHIVILESSQAYGAELMQMVRDGTSFNCQITLCHTIAHGKSVLRDNSSVDAILLSLKGGDGVWHAIIQHIREINATTPILMIAGAADETAALHAMQSGAQDYLIKGEFTTNRLVRSILSAMERERLRFALEKSVQQKITAVERRFQEMVTKSADGLMVLNKEGIIRYVNPMTAAFFGRRQSDFIGRHFDLVSVDTGIQEFGFTNSLGQSIYGEFQTVQIDWGDEPAYMVSIRDVTQQRKNAQMLEQNAQMLEKVAADLQAQNEDLEAYAHTVAHDIKAPLGIMIGFTAALYEQHQDLPPEALSRYLNNVYRSGRKAEAIINELLLLASVRKQQVKLSPIDMGYVVGEVLERLKYMIDDEEAALYVPESWPIVQGYAPWVEEVWVNYLSNALKYGGSPPHIGLGFEERPHDVLFWVQDNGDGLSDEAQEQLFKQFPKIDSVRANGHGLGLSIVRRIITRLKGDVGVQSQVGNGSRFFFTLPRPS